MPYHTLQQFYNLLIQQKDNAIVALSSPDSDPPTFHKVIFKAKNEQSHKLVAKEDDWNSIAFLGEGMTTAKSLAQYIKAYLPEHAAALVGVGKNDPSLFYLGEPKMYLEKNRVSTLWSETELNPYVDCDPQELAKIFSNDKYGTATAQSYFEKKHPNCQVQLYRIDDQWYTRGTLLECYPLLVKHNWSRLFCKKEADGLIVHECLVSAAKLTPFLKEPDIIDKILLA